MTEEIAVRVRGLHVTYTSRSGPIHALQGVDFTVQRGSTVGVVGESGSGKSTLARAIVGLVPITKGTIEVDGEPVNTIRGSRDRRAATRSQMIFQDPYSSLNPWQRPIGALAEAVKFWQRCNRAEASEEARRRLNDVGISSTQAKRAVTSLSGGQLQRIAIARALIPKPSVLVADEPTSALDQSIAASILNLLRETQQRSNLSIVFISHDLGVIQYLCDSVYVMQNGKVVESGATSRVFEAPERDYTRLLLQAIPGRSQR